MVPLAEMPASMMWEKRLGVMMSGSGETSGFLSGREGREHQGGFVASG